MRIRKLFPFVSLSLASLFVLVMLGCGTGSSSNGPMIRFINALAQSPSTGLNLTLGSATGAAVNSSPLTYGTFTTYTTASTGAVTGGVEDVVVSGQTTPIATTTATLSNNTSYTIAVSGDATQTGVGNTAAPVLNQYTDSFPTSSTLTSTTTTAYLRVINLVVATQGTQYNPISIYSSVSGAAAAPVSGMTNISYQGTSSLTSNPYVPITWSPAPTLSVVSSTGTTLTTTTSLSSLPIQPQHAWTLILIGEPNSSTAVTLGQGLNYILLQDE